ncbi:DUF2752 domain-containing protein [Crocosphaera chwakensis]|uniref:DUF2752 domain-containing protein n=1 Tax=Crocosphaera chwakensis CCY0110 TaxID=391612 RepID=A3IPV4_9CHRO|nr:DUF2752 domain-containing protein [Crocosphaera chwakensis]EAZ91594.1 hypothetical protein CY0110_13776 [Crocosphaera chwakensis CCY0110]
MLLTNKQKINYLSSLKKKEKIIKLLLLVLPILVSYLTNLGLKLPLPGCPLLHYVGIPCPGWGLTRSFKAIAQGNLLKAIDFHLFGPILFIIFLTVSFHLIQEIVNNKNISNIYIKIIKNPNYQIIFLLILFGYHGTRLHSLWKTGRLYTSFINSPVIQWILNGHWSLLTGN